MSPLHDACRDGDTERVRQLLDDGLPVDEKDERGSTALMLASSKGHTEVVQLLLGKGAAVDEKIQDGDTALLMASAEGHSEVVQLLLGKGAAVDEKSKYGSTALMLASSKRHTEVVQLLLGKGALVDKKDQDGWTALMLASSKGHTEVVQLLLDKGAAVDAKNERGRTALLLASECGQTEVVQLLLDKGAAVDQKDKDGRTALLIASEKGHSEVVQLLLNAVLKLRLEKGASLLEKDAGGMTLLMHASRHGHTEVVQLLLGKGAAVDEKKDKYGYTALMLASQHSHREVVQLLHGKGAAIDEKNKDGDTALMWASRNCRMEMVQLLLDKGAAINEKDKAGKTALMQANLKGHTELVQLLLDRGAALDEKDKDGDTALTWAHVKLNTEVVRLLLGKGASVDEVPVDRALPALVGADEDQLGRMAAGLLHKRLLEGQEGKVATAEAVLKLVRLAGFARERALKLRSSDPHSADDHQVLFGRLQLAAAACVQYYESGKARDELDVLWLFRSDELSSFRSGGGGRKALEHAVQIEAKELLAQPVVQGYIKDAWRGERANLGWAWVLAFFVLLLNLLFFLPLVALVPPLDRFLRDYDACYRGCFSTSADPLHTVGVYLLSLPVVKFGLECAADLALALALTLIPATDLATAPIAPLLLAWVGSGLLWEARQVMASSSSDATSRPARVYNRLTAYWADGINRVDASALIFSSAALIASLSSTDDNGVATATSLRVVAVLLLWFRLLRVLLVSSWLGPYVLMFFRMLSGDLVSFLVLLAFLLLAFAASFTVLLEPEPALLAQQSGDDQNWRWTRSHAAHLETAGCADELGGLDFVSTLTTLVEGALTGNDFFQCARDSTKSPLATWGISLVFVTLTSVLLLNMLIAMMAKTFDNISEASATNYLFLFAQRTLALQNEPPTPPPLNALGLPCRAVCLLWKIVVHKLKHRHEGHGGGGDKPDSSAKEVDGRGEDKEETFAQKIEPLVEKITEYINGHQDDAAQEDRWRTTMKRETMRRFREQREAINTQGEAIAEVRRAIDQQREATAEVHRLIVKISNSLGLAGADGVTNQFGAEMDNLEC